MGKKGVITLLFIILFAFLFIILFLISPTVEAKEKNNKSIQNQQYSQINRITGDIRLSFLKGDDRLNLAIEIRKKEIEAAIDNIKNKNQKQAINNLKRATEKLTIIQDEISLSSSEEIKKDFDEITDKINKEKNLPKEFEEYLYEEQKTYLILIFTEKILKLCKELGEEDINLMLIQKQCHPDMGIKGVDKEIKKVITGYATSSHNNTKKTINKNKIIDTRKEITKLSDQVVNKIFEPGQVLPEKIYLRESGCDKPESITFDSSDNSFWIMDWNDREVYHFDNSGDHIGGFDLENIFRSYETLGAITFDPRDDTLWILNPNRDYVHHTSRNGQNLSDGFSVANLGTYQKYGIAFDPRDNTFWITNYYYVYHIDSYGNDLGDGFNPSVEGSSHGKDIALDTRDYSFWIHDYYDRFIYHFDSYGNDLGDGFALPGDYYADVAFNSRDSSLWISDNLVFQEHLYSFTAGTK